MRECHCTTENPKLTQRGNGKTPFKRELRDQIKDISEEITRLADFGKTEEEKAERIRLIARRKELKSQYFYI